jgi:hypothetical protein
MLYTGRVWFPELLQIVSQCDGLERRQMITSREALKIAFQNKYKRWIPASPSEIGDEKTAMARLSSNDYFIPSVTPKFRLDPIQPVFTIGSCFARNIEDSLIARGIRVINQELNLSPDLLVTNAGPGNAPAGIRAILNKYSTAGIRNELERVFTPCQIPQDGLIEVEGGYWIDPHLSLLKSAPLEIAQATRAEVTRITSMIRDAGTVFITLGLTETWFDSLTGLHMNAGPPPQLMRSDSGRFTFENRDVFATLEDLRSILRLLRIHTRARVILTVSPVPLNTTWTSLDVASANVYSKSTLRVAAGILADESHDVDYFPSYEMVTLSPRHLAFGPDQLHVRQPMVRRVIDHFLANYSPSE